MILSENVWLGLLFTAYWLIILSAGVLLVMALTYVFRKFFAAKPSPTRVEEVGEGKSVEEELELSAAISAAIAYVTSPTTVKPYVEKVQESSASLWKASSILSSTGYEGVG
jgi:hypothetical protein